MKSSSKTTILTSASDEKSSHNSTTNRGFDMKTIMANTSKMDTRRRDRLYEHDAEGNPTGVLLDTLLFSDLLKTSITKNKKNEEIRFPNRFAQPAAKLTSKLNECLKPGNIPITNTFHLISNRERRNDSDDGLDDEDLTAADGIVRKAKIQVNRKDTNRRSIVYQNIRLTKGEFSFPHRTYRPKVQVAYRVPVGQAPQAVILERLHRAYRRTDINVVLQSMGIELEDLIPLPHYGETNERFYQEMMFRNRSVINGKDKKEYIMKYNEIEGELLSRNKLGQGDPHKFHHPDSDDSISYPSTNTSQSSATGTNDDEEADGEKKAENVSSTIHPFIKAKPPFGSMFPLDVFDNEEFDIRTGDQWIDLGYDSKTNTTYPIPGKAFLPYATEDTINRNAPAFSELTYERVLKKSERLQNFRNWLMESRYEKAMRMSGHDPNKIALSRPSQMQIQTIARTESIIPSLFPLQEIPLVLKKTKKPIIVIKDDLGISESMESIYRMEENVVEEETDETSMTDVGSVREEFKHEFAFVTNELLADHYKDIPSDSDNAASNPESKAEKGTIIKKEIKRSESILPDVFSDFTPPQIVASEAITVQEEVVSDSHMDVEEEEAYQHRKRRIGQPSKTVKKDSDDEGDYGYNFPTSPDIDAFDDGFDDIVFDYNKMKKTHIYEWRWVDVAVFDYNETTHQYLVRSIFPPHIFAWIGKTYLCFDGEDPIFHCQRIRDAVIRRFEMENTMRYNLYVDCLPITKISSIPRNVMRNIAKKAMCPTRLTKFKVPEKSKSMTRTELDFLYKRTHCLEKFEYIVQKHPRIYKPWLKIPEKVKNSDQENEWERVRPRYLSTKHFQYKVQVIQSKSVIFAPEPYIAYQKVVGFCQDALQESFLIVETNRSWPIEVYKTHQDDHMEAVLHYLKDRWFQNILFEIRSELKKIPNTWHNLNELRWDIFMMSKLSKFLHVIHHVMSNTVRTMVLNSVRNYVNHMKSFTMHCEGHSNFNWGYDLVNSRYPTPAGLVPILELQLYLDRTGPKYTNLLYRHYEILNEIISHVIKTASEVPRLLPIIMPQFLFGDKDSLLEMFEDEPEIVDLKRKLVRYTKLALRPVDTYAQKYRRYQFTVDADVSNFITEWNSENRTTSDVRKMVDQLRNEIEVFEEEIPFYIDITAFRVVTSFVRDDLIKKKSKTLEALLQNFATKLKNTVLQVKEDYTELEKKLMTRSEDIEEVMELKEYADMVPANITRLEEIMQRTLKDYEIFERFCFAIPNEDTELKWSVAIECNRALRMAHDAVTWLNDDYDRLLKTHQQDMSIFSDQIDSATLSVQGLVAFIELDKAADVVNEVKKVWATIMDIQQQNVMLNKRQKIFGMTATQNKAVERLIKDIEPFKNLWITAAEWIHLKESVFKDVLDKIDMTALTNIIENGGKTIEKCIEDFTAIDTVQHVAQEVFHQIITFKRLVPLIRTLKNPGMRQRHWEAISERCGFSVVSRGSETFKKLFEKGIEAHAEFIANIGTLATYEHEIEAALDMMERNIRAFKLEFTEFGDRGLSLIEYPTAAMQAVHQYYEKTIAIGNNPYRSSFEDRLSLWERKITVLKQNLENWFLTQERWIELQDIFSIPFASKTMPQEMKLFQHIDWIWRRLIRRIRKFEEFQDIAMDSTIATGLHSIETIMNKIQESLEERRKMQDKGSDSED